MSLKISSVVPTLTKPEFYKKYPEFAPLRLSYDSFRAFIQVLSEPTDEYIIVKNKNKILSEPQSIAYSAYEAYINEYPRTTTRAWASCTENINMVPMFVSNIRIANNKYINFSGEFNPINFIETLNDEKNKEFSSEEKSEILEKFQESVDPFLQKNNEIIKYVIQKFKICTKPFFFLPIGHVSFICEKIKGKLEYSIMLHANGLLLGKDGRVIRIEPHNNFLDADYDIQFDKKLIEYVTLIGVPSPRLVPIRYTCPQTIINTSIPKDGASDINCLFWTFFLYTKITELDFDKDPNEAIEKYSRMPREKLQNIIENFKVKLVSEIIPKGLSILGWRWPRFESFKYYSLKYVHKTYGSSLKTRKTKHKTSRKSKKLAKKRFNL